MPASFIPTKGYAERPGWRLACAVDSAASLRQAASTDKIAPNRVWAEVELSADNDLSTRCPSSEQHAATFAGA